MPLPDHAASFQEGWADGKLLLQRCTRCAHVPGFPRIACPRCFDTLEWFEAPGAGRVVSFTILRRTHNEQFEPHVPIVLALIGLDAGPELIATVVGSDRLSTQIGRAVDTAREHRWSTLVQFQLVD